MEQTLHNAFKRFSLGDELRAYTFLAAALRSAMSPRIISFSVSASAQGAGVSVIGDWNLEHRGLPMTLVEYGIWGGLFRHARGRRLHKFISWPRRLRRL